MKRWVANVLLIFFCAVFLVSGYFVVNYILDSREQKGHFDTLAQMVEQVQSTEPVQQTLPVSTEPEETAPEETEPEEPTGPVLVQVTDPETGELVEVLPEYAELYTINNDLVGWMYLEDTDINYPVMYHPDSSDYYLHKNFYKEYSSHGCPYIREACSIDPYSDNVTIFGHNMPDGTMFHDLHNYKDQSFWQTHKTITFNSLTEYREYEILAAFQVAANASSGFPYHLFVDAADETEFANYVAKCKELAYYDTGVTAEYGDKLITLSTCDRSITNGRMVVVAKLVTEE